MPRKFSDFRPKVRVEPASSEEPIEFCVQRLMATIDGRRFMEWMLEQAVNPCPGGHEDRALREAEGLRKFVANIRKMAEGDHVRERADRRDSDGG